MVIDKDGKTKLEVRPIWNTEQFHPSAINASLDAGLHLKFADLGGKTMEGVIIEEKATDAGSKQHMEVKGFCTMKYPELEGDPCRCAFEGTLNYNLNEAEFTVYVPAKETVS